LKFSEQELEDLISCVDTAREVRHRGHLHYRYEELRTKLYRKLQKKRIKRTNIMREKALRENHR